MKKVTKDLLKAGQTVYVVRNGEIETFRISSKPYQTENGYWVCDTPDSYAGKLFLGDIGIAELDMLARKTFFSRKRAESYLKSHKDIQHKLLAAWQRKIKEIKSFNNRYFFYEAQ